MTKLKLRASSSERWINCPGSTRLEHGIPEDVPSMYAKAGIQAHEIAATILNLPERTIEAYKKLYSVNDNILFLPIFFNVEAYVNYINEIMICDEHTKFLLIERKVDFSHVLPDAEDPTGTCDALIIDDVQKILHIIDFKYGKGVKVEVENNPQLLLYALGAINDLQFLYDIDKIVLHIVQPRIDNLQHQELTIEELEPWKTFFIEKSQLALSEDAPRIPSKKACKFCKAKTICPEYQEFNKPFTINEFDDLTLTNQEN